jgi:hypothetical protein
MSLGFSQRISRICSGVTPPPPVTSWCSEGSTNGHRSLYSYGFSRFRGRPPLAALAVAAAAFAFDPLRPPRRPVAAANRRLPNARSARPGTYISTSSDGHDNASLAGEITIVFIVAADALSSPGTAFRGIAIDPPPPNLSSMTSRSASYPAFITAARASACGCLPPRSSSSWPGSVGITRRHCAILSSRSLASPNANRESAGVARSSADCGPAADRTSSITRSLPVFLMSLTTHNPFEHPVALAASPSRPPE